MPKGRAIPPEFLQEVMRAAQRSNITVEEFAEVFETDPRRLEELLAKTDEIILAGPPTANTATAQHSWPISGHNYNWISNPPQREEVQNLRRELRLLNSRESERSHALGAQFVERLINTLVSAFDLDDLALYAHRTVAPNSCWTVKRADGGHIAKRAKPGVMSLPDGISEAPDSVWRTGFIRGRGPSPIFLQIHRTYPFTDLERSYLDVIAAEIALEVYPRLSRRLASGLDEMLRGGKELTDRRAGTLFATLTGQVARLFAVKHVAYFSCSGKLAYNEYKTRESNTFHSKAAPVRGAQSITLPEVFLKSLRAGDPFFWLSPSSILPDWHWQDIEIYEWPPEASSDELHRMHKVPFPPTLLVIPVNDSAECLGFWALAYRHESRPPAESLRSADLGEEIVRNAGYLVQRRFKTMIVDPIYAGRDTRVVEGQCGVLMPFMEAWSDRIWSKCITPYLSDVGFSALRADDLYGRDVMEDIWEMILSSEVIIADITGRNANVFYELGLAHAIGKIVILITQNKDDIPFDLNRYRHVIYEDNADGYETLRDGLAGALNEVLRGRLADSPSSSGPSIR